MLHWNPLHHCLVGSQPCLLQIQGNSHFRPSLNGFFCFLRNINRPSLFSSSVWGSTVLIAKHHTFISSKQAHISWYKEEFSLLFPVTWVLLLGNAPILSFGLCTTRTAPWKDYADNKPQSYQAVAIYPGIMLCEWLTGKAQGDLVTGKGCHLFIYFPPCLTNSKNRPLFGNRSTRQQEDFC